jgi:hypothetical protein
VNLGEVKIVKKKVLLILLALSVASLMLVALALPAFGISFTSSFSNYRRPPLGFPAKGTYTGYSVTVVTGPGTMFNVTSAEYGPVLDRIGFPAVEYYYEAPWGNSIAGSVIGSQEFVWKTDTGSDTAYINLTFAQGSFEGITFGTFNGLGTYTYNGPTVTFYNPVVGATGTLTQGTTYFGILASGAKISNGISGKLEGASLTETYTGIVILEQVTTSGLVPVPPPLFEAVVHVLSATYHK